MSKQVSNHIQNRKGFTGLEYVALNGHDWIAAGSYEVDPYKFNEEQLPEYVQKVESHLKLNHKVWTRILIGEEAILYNWQNDFDTAEDRTRWMIETAITELRDPEKARIIKLRYSVQSLVITANARIKKKGFSETCSRCNGSGNHSINARGDSTCYKCKGLRTSIPRLTKKKKQEIEAAFAEGWE